MLNHISHTSLNKEFLVAITCQLETDCLVYIPQSAFYLLVETFTWDVRTYSYVWMTCPDVQCSLIEVASQLYTLMPGFIVLQCIEFLGAVGC